jgi:hypothetical protein
MFVKFLLALEKVQRGSDFPRNSKLVLQKFVKHFSHFIHFSLFHCRAKFRAYEYRND